MSRDESDILVDQIMVGIRENKSRSKPVVTNEMLGRKMDMIIEILVGFNETKPKR